MCFNWVLCCGICNYADLGEDKDHLYIFGKRALGNKDLVKDNVPSHTSNTNAQQHSLSQRKTNVLPVK